MTPQQELSVLLKHKGIGPSGSKSLNAENIIRLKDLLTHTECSLATRATILTALLALPPNELELELLRELNANYKTMLPSELWGFIDSEFADETQVRINKVIAHENQSSDDAYLSLRTLIDEESGYRLAAYLEAQRLKRETFDENRAFLSVLQQTVSPVETDLPLLIDFGDSFDGCVRHAPLSLFVAATLAAAGYPALVQGAEWQAPKEGITYHKIMAKAGKNPLLSVEEVIAQLQNPNIGWAYIDQAVFSPGIDKLKQIRREMVKRPFIATFEKMLQPIRAKRNFMLTQYTHSHYRLEIAKLVQTHCEFELALHVKGLEGTCMVKPSDTEAVRIDPDSLTEMVLNGEAWGYELTLPRFDNATADDVLAIQQRTFDGATGPYCQFIEYQCVHILHHLLGVDLVTAQYQIRQALDSGEAMLRWQQHA